MRRSNVASDHLVLDAALVDTTGDLEVAVGSPVGDGDGVAAEHGAGDVLVHAGLVAQEVLVHGEGGGDGAILVDVLLDVSHAVEGVDGLGHVLVLGVRHAVAGVALGSAGGGGASLLAIGARALDVVLAGGDLVGAAGAFGVVVAAGHDALGGEELPRGGGHAAVAALAAEAGEAGAAGGDVLGAHHGVGLSALAVGGSAAAVVEGLDGPEGPAGAARRLVADLLHDGALGPLVTLVKGGGQGDAGVGVGPHRQGGVHCLGLGVLAGAHEARGLGQGPVEEVRAVLSRPRGGLGAHGAQKVVVVDHGGRGHRGDGRQSEHCGAHV